ncbi:hypothetical protein GCM10009718_33280 [Isoptericola halotolerans]|uniref:Uncharacterized protein n=1 Tax=Isoptericola halotolerans TaxID=300560 RepID=A0ABX2A6J5_9MICO|nr:hypothetical protein [Isoptericola halotolerans]NOV98216.1 hypothetical protein [Isoptericola halotolerans]
MLAHLQALEASLATLGRPVHRIYAPDDALADLPYLVLEAPGWGGVLDMPVCGTSHSLHTTFRVKAVGANPDSVLLTLRRVRALWSPAHEWTTVPMPGRLLQVHYERSEAVFVDRDVTMPASNTHPGVGVETYSLDSQPA